MRYQLLIIIATSIVGSVFTTESEKLSDIYSKLNTYYDSFRPPLHSQFTGQVQPIKASNYHPKRCSHTDPGTAIQFFQVGTYKNIISDEPVLVGSPCLFSDSLGNWLSNYFETILCAQSAGMHYMAVAKIWEPFTNDTSEPFLTKLPGMIQHAKPVAGSIAKVNLEFSCPCTSLCHEKPNALWTNGTKRIKPIMWDAINYHQNIRKLNQTIVLSSDMSDQSPGTILPFVPDVAIHYRCGDNFVGHYGFLPFSAFKNLVPENAKTVYVLAEKRSRKTAQKVHRAVKCDAIFASLYKYLRRQFPSAVVLIRRGDDLYSDLIRLASARTTICSVSSFCLWPAFVNNHNAYFPLTKLIVRQQASLDLGFKWISQPQVLLGSQFENLPTKQLIDKLENM